MRYGEPLGIDPADLSRRQPSQVPTVPGHVIGGKVVAGTRTAPRRRPADGTPLGDSPVGTPEEVQAALRSARAAQPGWQELGPRGRDPILRHLRERLAERAETIADHVVAETGKPRIEAYYEVMTVLEGLEFALDRAPHLLAEFPLPLPQIHLRHKRSFVTRVPHGVVGLVMPWNFPFAIPAGEVFQAIAMGNTVVLKPSELTPFTGLLIGGILLECGLPTGVVNVVAGDGTTGSALVEGAIDKLTFVGSVATGRRVEAALRPRGIPVSLELGGKDPALVLPDAEVATAAQGIVWGAMMNAGQGCSSVERCFVHESVYSRFAEAATEAARAIVVGPGEDPLSWMGPLIDRRQLAKVEQQVEDARSKGATVLCGGKVREDLGPLFYEPTVLGDVTPGMLVMQEETFGPLLPLRRVPDLETAIAEANASPYALGASVWSRDVEKAERVGRRLVTGSLWINDLLFSHAAPQAPWGGPRDSGGSRTHGDPGLLGYVRPVYVAVDDRSSGTKDAWYPYGPERLAFTRAALDLLHRPGLVRKLSALPAVVRGKRPG